MEGYDSTRRSSWCALSTALILLVLGFDGTTFATARVLLPSNPSTEFITTNCNNTTYPSVCISSLFPYASTIQASPTQLTRTAILVSLTNARSTSNLVTSLSTAGGMTPREGASVSDCTVTMGDAVAQLQRSLDAVRMLGGKDAVLHANDMLTWMSAALTDEQSCMDGLASSAKVRVVKSNVRDQVWKALQLTCNALSFLNTLASKISAKKGP